MTSSEKETDKKRKALAVEKLKNQLGKVGNILFSVSDEAKTALRPMVHALVLKNNRQIFATVGTGTYLGKEGVDNIIIVSKLSDKKQVLSIEQLIKEQQLSLIVNIPSLTSNNSETTDGQKIRQLAQATKTAIITEVDLAVWFLTDLLSS
ncbi:MAG: hypothetical protein WC621_00045 [Patescibacteria group bacterium]